MHSRERKIYDFIVDYIMEHCYPPTVREICAAINIKSTSTVHADIHDMIEHGYLETDNEEISSKSRALRVPGYRMVRVEGWDKN